MNEKEIEGRWEWRMGEGREVIGEQRGSKGGGVSGRAVINFGL